MTSVMPLLCPRPVQVQVLLSLCHICLQQIESLPKCPLASEMAQFAPSFSCCSHLRQLPSGETNEQQWQCWGLNTVEGQIQHSAGFSRCQPLELHNKFKTMTNVQLNLSYNETLLVSSWQFSYYLQKAIFVFVSSSQSCLLLQDWDGLLRVCFQRKNKTLGSSFRLNC